MHPRRAAAAGLVFFAIAGFYYVFQTVESYRIDYAGLTVLIALGFATSIMAYVLFAGLKQD